MADTQVTSFAALTGGNLAVGDLFPVIDISAAGAMKNSIITSAELIIGLKALGSFAALTANTFTAAQLIDGSADAVQLTLQGHSTQTSSILLVEKSDGTDLLTFSNTGGLRLLKSYSASDYHLGDATGGISWSSGGSYFTIGGFTKAAITGNDGLVISAALTIGFTSGHADAGSNDAFFARKAAATIQMGTDAAGVTNQHFTAASRITSNGAGANLTISAGNCRGTTGEGGVGGSLIFATYAASGTTNTIGNLTTRLTLDTTGLLTFADAVDMAFNTTTGTKIGTATGQKIGFWNATPVVQQVLATGGGATVDNVISLLQTLGLCKQS